MHRRSLRDLWLRHTRHLGLPIAGIKLIATALKKQHKLILDNRKVAEANYVASHDETPRVKKEFIV